MITYNNIITALNNFADNHFFIKAFSHGDADEMLLQKYQSFPLMHVFYSGSTYDEGQKDYSLEIYIVDLPSDKINKVQYQKEAVSDAEQCAEDLLADLSNGFKIFNADFLFDTENASISPIIEETSQVVSGIVLNITISVPYQHDSCNAPLTGVTPPSPADCDDATVENSDATYSTTVAAGGTLITPNIQIKDSAATVLATIPSVQDYTVGDGKTQNSDVSYNVNTKATEVLVLPDITVTDMDTSTRTVPSVLDVICAWATILAVNSADTTLATAATYPAAGKIIVPDITFTDSDGTSSAQPAGINLTCTPAVSPSGYRYQHVTPTQYTSYQTYDTGWHVQNSSFDYTPPVYPLVQACLHTKAMQSGVRATPATGTSSGDSVFPTMMVENTVDGTKFRFTDDQGNPSDATVGANIWAHVDWNGHSWAGCTNQGLVYDHLHGTWLDVDYLIDGTKYTQDTTNGQSWATWMTKIGTMTHKGSSDWLPLNADKLGHTAIGARTRYSTWALEFFNGNRSDNRFIALTGDTPTDSTTSAFYLGNYATSTYGWQRQTKSTSTSFNQIITNIFVFRIDRR